MNHILTDLSLPHISTLYKTKNRAELQVDFMRAWDRLDNDTFSIILPLHTTAVD